MMKGNWNYPTSVRFGDGRIRELADLCRELGMKRPLIVTDRGLVELAPVLQARAVCEQAGLQVGVFSDVQGNPVGDNVTSGVAAYKQGGHDGVIALGGGSALDVAKAVALMVGQTGSLWDYEDVGDNWTRVDPAGMAPVVAVPTTSGTGSEVGRASVITDEATHTKRIIFHPRMLPARVICDPVLTVGLPSNLTAWVGIDALSHNLEAWCAPGFHPQADGIALEGMRLVHRYLLRAVRNPGDLEARGGMMAASLMGATAFQKGLGAMHAIAHPVGAVHNTHHGLTNAVVMPYVLRFNEDAVAERLGRAAAYLGLAPGFAGFLDWVLDLRAQTGIPAHLGLLGIAPDAAVALLDAVLADASGSTNPVALTPQSVEPLLRAVAGE